ncbi:helix-turn-helix transcriptional regulator [Pelagicoccus mobilis]|uniref:Helix-turn-helix transcriptional regulator n=1 Tax=Pelagicoccus mobilis TaxID=415221 RepID=A0A934S3R9_9BACT|nr:AraC family transcriptional regulator [Pelagicoccus mobilis]MBK1880650.1 helix-turn-helix transcriptional regulator [Pelagicoccus mobilis]
MAFSIENYRIEELFRFEMERGGQPYCIGIPAGVVRVEVMLEGGGWILHEDRSVRVDPGMMIMNQAGDETIYRAYPETGYVCLACNIRLGDGVERIEIPRFCRWSESVEHAKSFTERSIYLFGLPGYDQRTLVNRVLGEVFFHVEESTYREERDTTPLPMKLALEYLEAHFMEGVTLPMLAQVSGYSRSRFHELFTETFGSTPQQYQMDLKMRQAKRLILQSTHPIKWIAAECGFSSASSFSTTFSKEVGMGPNEFRREKGQLLDKRAS